MSRRTIKSWPEEERPRERLFRYGPARLSHAQLLALLLGTGDSRRSAVELAVDLLARYRGDLRELARAPAAELCGMSGVGRAKAARVAAALELGRRLQEVPLREGEPIRRSRDVFEACHAALRDLDREVFQVVLLNGRHRVIRPVTVSEGTLTACLVHPRQVFAPALREAAAAVLLVHNHPSGDPAPSPEDLELNRRLVRAGEVLGIRVLDHLVIGHGRYVSFADQGLMPAL